MRLSNHKLAWCLLNRVILLTSLVGFFPSSVDADHGDADDPHGGVPMGVKNTNCDDGVTNTSIDWDPMDKDPYTCHDDVARRYDIYYNRPTECEATAKRPLHICYPYEIPYLEDIPTSGAHRPLWPKYGEYYYLPIQRWLHSLEHGSIVFLYHPCADRGQIETFKSIAKNCIRRHIITPFKNMPPEVNFVVVSWKCKHYLSYPRKDIIEDFVKGHALQAPEKGVYSDGQYKIGLKEKAAVVSDMHESNLCPNVDLNGSTYKKLIEDSKRRREYYAFARSKLRRILERLSMLNYGKY